MSNVFPVDFFTDLLCKLEGIILTMYKIARRGGSSDVRSHHDNQKKEGGEETFFLFLHPYQGDGSIVLSGGGF